MHEPNWDDLRFFLACMRTRSLSAAARSLGVQQSTVSRRLVALETGLDTSLFHRTSAGLVPSDFAERIQPEVELMENRMAAISNLAAGESAEISGPVRLALTEGLALNMLLPSLQRVYEQYPRLKVELITSDKLVDLTRREADIALRFVPPTKGELVFQRVARLKMGILIHRDTLAKYPDASLEDLPWITSDIARDDSPETRWFSRHVDVEPHLKANSYVVQMQAVQRGLGAAVVPTVIRHQNPDLVELAMPKPTPEGLPLYLVTPKILRHVPKIDAVWHILIKLSRFLDENQDFKEQTAS